MKLRISALADADLDHLYSQGIMRFGEKAADEYISEIRSKFALLLDFPLSNVLRDEIIAVPLLFESVLLPNQSGL